MSRRELSGLEDVPDACRSLSAAEFVVTSVPWSESRIANLHLRQEHMIAAISDKRSDVPKGTGDFLSGVFAHDWEIGLATARTEMLIDASSARSQLAIAESASHWLNAKECDTQLLA